MNAIDPRIEQILSQIEIYQAIAANDYGVPAWQAMPIASKPDIAFRPKCSQLEAIWQPTDTAWVWQGQSIHNTPGQGTMTPQTALELQGAGVCVTGSHAVDVPLVPTDSVYQEFVLATSSAVALIPESSTSETTATAQTESNPAPTASILNFPLILGGLMLIGGCVYFAFTFLKQKQSKKENQVFRQPQPKTENEATEGSDELDYDFEL